MKLFLKFLLVIVIALSLYARAYAYQTRFAYDHDSDLSAWIVKDILVDKHPRLIGQLTSAPGVFIGSLFYYSLIPFYLSSGLDPLGTVSYSWIVGIIGVLSINYVVSRLHNPRAGVISAFFYAISFGLSLTERQVVPTMWIFVWSIWFYYAAVRLYQGDRRSLLLHALLFSLVWHIQFNLAILAPIVVVGFILNIRRFNIKEIVLPILLFLFLSLPLLGFEFRHNFSQLKSVFGSVKNAEAVKRSPVEKLSHVITYVERNANYIFVAEPVEFPQYLLPALISLGFISLVLRKRLAKNSAFIIISWFVIFITFFVIHPINLSEYYLNALNILWFIVAGIFLSYIPAPLWLALLGLFSLNQIRAIKSFTPSRNGYLQKSALITQIKTDAQSHNYPCVSISYITARGYELGYRYLIWQKGLKTAPISTTIPVYSIVFPLSLVDKVDYSFDSLGLVLPDYPKYTEASVASFCPGSDFNTTDSMFGFTK